jgi:hypothetical protein
VEHEVPDGDVFPLVGGIRAVHIPSHCAGQLAFLSPRHGGVLWAAEAAVNVADLPGLSPCHEDLEERKRSAKKLTGLASKRPASSTVGRSGAGH